MSAPRSMETRRRVVARTGTGAECILEFTGPAHELLRRPRSRLSNALQEESDDVLAASHAWPLHPTRSVVSSGRSTVDDVLLARHKNREQNRRRQISVTELRSWTPRFPPSLLAVLDMQAQNGKAWVAENFTAPRGLAALVQPDAAASEIQSQSPSSPSSEAKDIGDERDFEMTEFHRCSYQDSNLYFSTPICGGVYSIPYDYGIRQTILDYDGCWVPLPTYRSKPTIVHEIGHWLGLDHIFNNGCESEGEFLRRYPSSAWSLQFLTPHRQRYRYFSNERNMQHRWGWQLMDYNECGREFTPCQEVRITVAWNKLRRNREFEPSVVVTIPSEA
ncbi:hypothetical protein CC78DRAFT_611714 [Lojkania enalia]|uniref:Peptidase M43 pregnancy-associated plasma-A domain-containing protein n=1 Tax=Lojkania enalia TaxID=147567 RepID=A0A9P4NB93_9PLEO|nr:hypothetical protein CC78DRAFT_611714 [Didymosphaeria enalia]